MTAPEPTRVPRCQVPAGPKYSPAALVTDVTLMLSLKVGGIELDEPMTKKSWLHAALLMRGLGVTPEVDPADHSEEAEWIRELLLADRTGRRLKPPRAV